MMGFISENALLLIALSVLMHVAWNLLARHIDKEANFLWWGLCAHLVLIAPYCLYMLVKNIEWQNEKFIVALCLSAVANLVYFLALRLAYQMAPVALVYPMARSSPVLIAIWTWLLFDVDLSGVEWAAICVGVLGLFVLARTAKGEGGLKVILWTSLAAFCTSIYSITDQIAVPFLPGFAEQVGFISVGYALSFVGLSVMQKRETGFFIPQKRPPIIYIIIGGLFIGTAYAMVVRAMLYLPAAHVVSFTNGGIVIATLLSIFLFNENRYWQMRLVIAIIMSLALLVLGLNRL